MRTLLLFSLSVALALVSACTADDDDDTTTSSSSSSGLPGGGCQAGRHDQCPAGYACKASQCTTSCDPTNATPMINGCVPGATCQAGQCVNNTTCNETTDCAFYKGEVCDFSAGRCVAASETCTEVGGQETLCSNGFTCHVSVCYEDCSGSKGCPSSKTCSNNSCH